MVWMSQRKLSSRQIPDRADHHDIVIAGGGMVGSAAAIALSKLGKAICILLEIKGFCEGIQICLLAHTLCILCQMNNRRF